MSYRGIFKYGAVEVANSARVAGLASIATPLNDTVFTNGSACSCSANFMGYPDWWTGQEDFFGGTYSDITDAPWYNPSRCESAQLHGFYPMVVEGLDNVKIQRELVESFCDGGHSTRHRDMSRTVRVEAMLIACDHAAAVYGLQWLTCQLRQSVGNRGADLTYLAASPEGSCVDPASLLRTIPDAVLLKEPTVIDRSGRGYGAWQNRHGSLWRIEWVWGSGNPYSYGPAVEIPVVWDDDVDDPIVWDDSCVAGGGCPVHVTEVTSPLCPPVTLPDPVAVQAGCSTDAAGCVPLCEGRRRTWEWTPSASMMGVCTQVVVDIWVSNPSAVSPVEGVTLSWVPVGGDVECDRVASVTISYIPPGAAVVLDSMRGKPLVLQDAQFLSAVGLVNTESGPWAGLTLEGVLSWQLVYDGQDDIEVTIWARPRDV